MSTPPFRDPQLLPPRPETQLSRREVLKAGAAWAALSRLPHRALGQCGATDRLGLPVYWNGWRVLNDNSSNPTAGTFSSATAPAAVCRDATHLDVVVIGNDSKIWTNSCTLTPANSSWNGWAQLPGGPFSNAVSPAVVARDANHLDVFVLGNDNKLWTNAWAGTWSGWTRINGGPFSSGSAPVAVTRDASHIDLFIVGNDGNLWSTAWTGSWSPWLPIGTGNFSRSGSPAVVSRSPATLDAVAMGADGRIYASSFNGSHWSDWSLVPGGPFLLGTSPVLIARDGTHLDLLVTGNDHQVWTNTFSTASSTSTAGSWAGWVQLCSGPGTTTSPAAAAPDGNNLQVFAVGGDGRTWGNKWQSGAWCGWSVVSDNPNAAAVSALSPGTPPVALKRDSTHLELLKFGTDTRVWRNTWGPAPAVYLPLSSTRLAQLTGDYDPTQLPHLNNTAAWGVSGTDMGCPVEFNGRLYLLFGDIPTTTPKDLDPICYTTDTSLSAGGFHLACVTGHDGQFLPMTVDGVGMLTNETATGAFAYNNHVFAFVVRGDSKPHSTLVVTPDPSTTPNFTTVREISSPTGRFWQVAPSVVQNARWSGLPSSSGDGLLLWGQSGSSAYLAWMPLTAASSPSATTPIKYYAAGGTWSDRESDATPIFSTFGITQISVTWLPGPARWLFMYTRASNGIPHESVVARVGTTPWTWSDELFVFNPDRDQAWGHYMDLAGNNAMHQLAPPRDAALNGYAYSPFLLNRYTTWNASTHKLVLTYLMATFVPYQVMLMQATLQLE